MHILLREAITITKDLGNVIFIGAVAILSYTKFSRESQDIDFIITYPISDEELFEKGYRKFWRSGKEEMLTPNQMKIDIYYNRDINNIPIQTLIDTARNVQLDKNNTIKAASLESLIVMKYRARRGQDKDDLGTIAQRKFNVIDWKALRLIAPTEVEFSEIYTAMKYYSKST
jgi:predicted nucleotidyltransferase